MRRTTMYPENRMAQRGPADVPRVGMVGFVPRERPIVTRLRTDPMRQAMIDFAPRDRVIEVITRHLQRNVTRGGSGGGKRTLKGMYS